MAAQESEVWKYPQPKEVLDLNWWNTSEEKVKEAYRVFATTYDEHIDPSGYVIHINCAEAFDKVASEIYGENKTNMKVLDLGCGTGLAGQVLKERYGFQDLVALDVSEDMLEKAKEKGVFNQFLRCFVTEKHIDEIQSGEFDGVISSGGITPGQIKPNAFDEIIRWVKPDGIICFSCREEPYNSELYGYKAKFEDLEKAKKWKLVYQTKADYYCIPTADEFSGRKALYLVYRVLP